MSDKIKSVNVTKANFNLNHKNNNNNSGSTTIIENFETENLGNSLIDMNVELGEESAKVTKSQNKYIDPDEVKDKFGNKIKEYGGNNSDYNSDMKVGDVYVDEAGHYLQNATLKDNNGNTKKIVMRINEDKNVQIVKETSNNKDG